MSSALQDPTVLAYNFLLCKMPPPHARKMATSLAELFSPTFIEAENIYEAPTVFQALG